MRDVKKTRKAEDAEKQIQNDSAIGELSIMLAQMQEQNDSAIGELSIMLAQNNRMKFDENSGLVKTWVRLVESKHYSKEQVPNIGNLREVVYKILEKGEVDK